MKTNPNDTAHPVTENNGLYGLTKREYFAAMALQGLCVGKSHKDIMSGQCVDIAQEATEIADALIEALNK